MDDMTEKKVVAIVEARMTSSRLPGKHLMKIKEKPILGYLLDRLNLVEDIDEIVVAMTIRTEDDELAKFVNNKGYKVYRGSEEDVMGRVLEAANAYDADVICEITGDCPIIDTNLVSQLIQTFLQNNNIEYVNNCCFGLPDGMGGQVFSIQTLEDSYRQTQNKLDREHVTLHIRRNPHLYRPIYMVPLTKHKWPGLGLTLDELADFELLTAIIENFNDREIIFNCEEVLEFLRMNPALVSINAKIVRKGAT